MAAGGAEPAAAAAGGMPGAVAARPAAPAATEPAAARARATMTALSFRGVLPPPVTTTARGAEQAHDQENAQADPLRFVLLVLVLRLVLCHDRPYPWMAAATTMQMPMMN